MASDLDPSTAPDRRAAAWQRALPWAGGVAIAALRLATAPKSLWEYDELLFAAAVERFRPLVHHPHPPGYPLVVGLGKLFALLLGDPFISLVALAVVASLIGFPLLLEAYRRLARPLVGDAAATCVAWCAALLFHLSPAMLVQGPLPMSDPPALLFLAGALLAAARLHERVAPGAALALGVAAAAAIGCRPQLAPVLLPMLAVALWPTRSPRAWGLALGSFTAVALAWLTPLVLAVGGVQGFLDYELGHADKIAAADQATWRVGWSAGGIALRFLAHPWGLRWVSLPVLLLALAGAGWLVARRARGVLPLAALGGVQLAICLAVMEPADGVRYALPSLLAVAFAAAVGGEALLHRFGGARHLLWLLPLAVGASGLAYAWPLVAARTSGPSPPVAAADFIRTELPPRCFLVVGKTLEPHAAYLLPGRPRAWLEAGMNRVAERPELPAWLLTEGTVVWPGARLFAWPEHDAYGKLTRDHFRTVSLVPLPPSRRYVALRGVHAFELLPPEPGWRWLDELALLRLAPQGHRRLRLRLGLLADAPLAENRVTIGVAGVDAATVTLPRGEIRELEVPLPAAAAVEVSFRAAAAFVPAELGYGTDRRRLALQLVYLETLP